MRHIIEYSTGREHRLTPQTIEDISLQLKCDCCEKLIGYIEYEMGTPFIICEDCKNRRL